MVEHLASEILIVHIDLSCRAPPESKLMVRSVE
jgi:hypothetical protein